MKTTTYRNLILLACLVFGASNLSSQDRTVGVTLNTTNAAPGYTLFAPLGSTTTYLIDLDGRAINSWESSYRPGDAVYLLPNGDLLRTGKVSGRQGEFGVAGGTGGIVERYDWDGNLLWQFQYADDRVRQHHDAIQLPNGNVLLIAWELLSDEDVIQAGRDPSLIPEEGLWGDHLVEIEPSGSEGRRNCLGMAYD